MTPANNQRWKADAFGWMMAAAFFVVTLVLCRAKWINQDPYLLDFAKNTRFHETVLQGIPLENRTFYYAFVYSGFQTLLLPISALFRSVAVIMVAHAAGFAACIVLLHQWARLQLGGRWLPAMFAAGFALDPAVDMIALSFQRPEMWCGAALVYAMIQLEERRLPRALAATVFAGLMRIDALPAFLMLGAVMWISGRKSEGRAVALRAIAMSGLLVLAAIGMRLALGPGGHSEQLHLDHFFQAEGGVAIAFAETVWRAESYTHLLLLAHVFFLPFLAPLWLLPALPSFAYTVLSHQGLWSMEIVRNLLSPGDVLTPYLHTHASVLLPALFAAAVMGFRPVLNWTRRRFAVENDRLPAAVLGAAFLGLHVFFTPPTLGPVPLTPSFNRDYYRDTPHARAVRAVLAGLPPDRYGLLGWSLSERAAYLPRTRELYRKDNLDASVEYVAFDLWGFSANIPRSEYMDTVEWIVRRNDFRVTRFVDGIVVLERGITSELNTDVLAFIETHRSRLAVNPISPYHAGWVDREEALNGVATPSLLPLP